MRDQADSLALSCLSELERLPPSGRSVFLLHDVFGRSLADTARIAGVGESACRRLLQEARAAMRAAKAKLDAERRDNATTVSRFRAAVRAGDLAALVDLLAADAIATEPGTARTLGREAVARRALLAGERIVSIDAAGGLVQTVRVTTGSARSS
jgi:hypothetical protein